MSAVKVYGVPQATCTMRILFTAFELGHPVDLIIVDRIARKQPAHLARQPFGKVPAAEDGDLSFFESRAICRYLVDKYAHEDTIKLVPSDIKARARFEQWMSLESTTYNPELTKLVVEVVGSERGIPKNAHVCKEATHNLIRDGIVLNKQLEGQIWIVDNTFSLVDICLVTYIVRIVNEPEIKEWFAKYPNIATWYENVTSRPAFQQVVAMGKKNEHVVCHSDGLQS